MPAHPARRSGDAVPAHQVSVRTDAVVDGESVRLAADSASKRNAFPGNFGYAAGMSDMQTHLRIEAWVRNAAYAKAVWIDVHIFDRDGALLRSETLPLRWARAAGDGGDVFALDGMLYQGSSGGPGSVDPRPDARGMQFRLYCEQDGRVLTDGLAHWRQLRMDSMSG